MVFQTKTKKLKTNPHKIQKPCGTHRAKENPVISAGLKVLLQVRDATLPHR